MEAEEAATAATVHTPVVHASAAAKTKLAMVAAASLKAHVAARDPAPILGAGVVPWPVAAAA